VNIAGEELLRKGDALFAQNRKLFARLANDDNQLHRALAEPTALDSTGVHGFGAWRRITSARDGTALSVLIARPPAKFTSALRGITDSTGFLVLVTNSDASAPDLAARLRELWGLTPAEASLVLTLLDSESLQSAADRLGISRNTAKTHLASAYSKIGVTRQSDLAKRIASLAIIRSPLR
jgi:DNA-binding CsgD family transcriptional regulator